MPRKKTPRLCAHCGKVLTRDIKRSRKGMPLFCTIDHALEYYQGEIPDNNTVEESSEKKIKTKVVNIKDIRHTNPDWMNDPLFVYIGRNVMFNPMKKSIFHNPFSVKNHGRKGCMEKFNNYFFSKVKSDSSFKEAIEGLRGKILVCWCKSSSACHGNVIVNYLHKPKTLENFHEKEKISGVDPKKMDLIFSLIRLHEIKRNELWEKEEKYVDYLFGSQWLSEVSKLPEEEVIRYLNTLRNKYHKIIWFPGHNFTGKISGVTMVAFDQLESKINFMACKSNYDYKGNFMVKQQRINMLFGKQTYHKAIGRGIIRSR